MNSGDHDIPYDGLNIGGQVVSTLHGRPYKTTHFNTIRAQHRAHTGKTTRPYITTSRNRIHQMRDTGNIIPLKKGHMRLSPQARKTMNLIFSHPELTNKQQAKCVNALAGVFAQRRITRDRSVLEVAATVTGSALSSRSSRISRPLSGGKNVLRDSVAELPTPINDPQQMTESLLELDNNRADEITEEPRVPDDLLVVKPGASQQPLPRRTITRHKTEVFCGLVTPGNSPTKGPGDNSISAIVERDVEMDDTSTGNHDRSTTPSPGSSFGSPAPRATEPQIDMKSAQNEIANLKRKNAALLEMEGHVLRKLSRNGQGTMSNIETVTDRAVRQRDELRAENQKLRAFIESLKSGIIDLQGQIFHMQDKLNRAEGERIEMAQSRRRWIARVWALAGRVPGELRKKDAEVENMREKLAGMHARLAQQQSRLRDLQGQLEEERVRRMGIEAEFDGSKLAHAQEIKDRNLAGQLLRDQLKEVVNSINCGAISI